MERRKLSKDEIAEKLTFLPSWAEEAGQIVKEFTFESYKAGLVFAVTVGHIADQMDHHPDLFIGYQKVRVALNTHDVGGISPLDFGLANKIESLV